MSWLMVMPVLDPVVVAGFFERCALDPTKILIIDNGIEPASNPDWGGRYYRDPQGRNLGVSHSWNLGALAVMAEQTEWLVVCSSSVRFGPMGGVELPGRLGLCHDAPGVEIKPYGWHLAALSRSTIERVGYFDENFYPGYFEDTDYLYRMALAGLASPRENGGSWCKVSVDGEFGEQARSLSDPRVQATVDFGDLLTYYRAKWGGGPGEEKFVTPFGEDHPIGWWPEIFEEAPEEPDGADEIGDL
ncbi:MAG TPA: hypothetical protein VMX12_12675 [Acidimicrobiia bacterium]|nr:hypothetical protein [Acidimicrobiia bacterium]